MAPSATTIELTIIVPALNEELYIADCLASLIGQAEAAAAEIVVADGGSIDRTRPIVRAMAARHPCIRLIDNPRRSQSAAINIVALASHAQILLRADAHAAYPPDFVRTTVAALRDHDATSVVVPMITAGRGGFQNAVAAAQNSVLGTGGSAHRSVGVSGLVDHGHHAVFDRAFFLRLGGYDESFSHNEDAELDRRAMQAGGRIWMCAEAPVTYFPRTTVPALARQYFRHGRGRAMTLSKHGQRPNPRQLAPLGALAAVALGLLAAPVQPLLLLLPVSYAGACLALGTVPGIRGRDPWAACSGVAAITMHLSWALGFITGAAGAATAGGLRLRRAEGLKLGAEPPASK